MFYIYYKTQNNIIQSADIQTLQRLDPQDIIWIDLNDPTGDEKREVEMFLETEIQSRAQAEEIESTSRYFETENAIFANTNFLISQPESFIYDTVSFTLCKEILITLHNSDLRTLTETGRKLQRNPQLMPTGFHLMIAILEQRIDLDADMIEGIAKEIAYMSKQTSLGEKVDEEQLLYINQMQENTMLIRENIIDKQRVLSSILRSNKFPHDLYQKLNFMIKDINSLINHTDFSFERLEYLQNTLLGLINIEQNKIIKIFTVATVIFAPPTLIASIYGMNFKAIPEFEWILGYPFAIGLMVTVSLIILWYFRKKKWL
ncbi:MAG: magnesium/cobalt transporter CorA [Prevotellaceae bacterium]|jgi:magnesium transporter|nr:magnesium/cobalt transporter CorA [Prevotellaceae bacterium]